MIRLRCTSLQQYRQSSKISKQGFEFQLHSNSKITIVNTTFAPYVTQILVKSVIHKTFTSNNNPPHGIKDILQLSDE